MLGDDELKAIDDLRFSRRMPSRAAAIRELLKRGLAADGQAVAKAGKRSREFGVLVEARQGSGRNGRSAR